MMNLQAYVVVVAVSGVMHSRKLEIEYMHIIVKC